MTTYAGSPDTLLIAIELGRQMSSVEASLAKISASQEGARESMVSALASGSSTPESLASFDPDTSSWRTSQSCLIEGWATFSERWPRSGMMRNGIAYRLSPLVPRISGTGFSSLDDHEPELWATPTAHDADHGPRSEASARKRSSRCLQREVRMWPTPNATPQSRNRTCKRHNEKSNHHDGLTLLDAVWIQEYELPRTAGGGQLNPMWVEWLIGFPLGWTELEGSETQ